MAAEAYDWAVREQAEELYVIDGRTYKEVATLTGVSISQLKRWGKDADWAQSQREHREALGIIKRKTVLLRKELLEKALGSKDPQNVYAFAALEKAVKPKEGGKTVAVSAVPVSDRTFETPGDAVVALQEAVQHKINEMISIPGALNLSGIKDMKQALELLEQMKAKYNPETKEENTGGLSDEAAEDIRNKILGISS